MWAIPKLDTGQDQYTYVIIIIVLIIDLKGNKKIISIRSILAAQIRYLKMQLDVEVSPPAKAS